MLHERNSELTRLVGENGMEFYQRPAGSNSNAGIKLNEDTPMPEPQYRFYVDHNDFTIRMVVVTREADATYIWNGRRNVLNHGSESVVFDWPTVSGWGHGAVVPQDQVHETIEAALDQLRGLIKQVKQHA